MFKCKRHPAIFTVQYLCRRKKSPDLFIALKISLQNFHDYFFINVSLQCLQIWLFFSFFENLGKYIINSITDEILYHYESVIIYQIIIFSI